MNYKFLFILISIGILLNSCFQKSENINSDNFIKVKGTYFELNNKLYNFFGTNLWYGPYLGSKGNYGDRERLNRELDKLQELGITNLRVLAASEATSLKSSVKPAFTVAPNEYNEELLDGLDYFLLQMEKRNMHAVLFLNNYWQWSGGMSQYVAWTSDEPIVDPDVTGDWDGFMEYSASFYVNDSANELFHNYITMLVNRKNKYTDEIYKNDPTIMAWQLANEPRPGSYTDWGRNNIPNFVRWIHKTAKFIHSVDTNHLVCKGNEGMSGTIDVEEGVLQLNDCKDIDFLTFHIWPLNWVWIDKDDPSRRYPEAKLRMIDYFNKHIDYARKFNKPVTLEEFGLNRENGKFDLNSETITRDEFLKDVFQITLDSIKAGSSIAGVNFWTWAGEGRPENNEFIWKEGDDFIGDPPQEPQGLYSVFDCDTSTIKIIKEYGEKFKSVTSNR